MALKLHGARRSTIAAWPALKAAKGAVVLMSVIRPCSRRPLTPLSARSTRRSWHWRRRSLTVGIADGVQVDGVCPGPLLTGRRGSYLQHWAPLHDVTVEEATANFPKEAGMARYGEPEEIAELMAFLVLPGARWITGSNTSHGWRRGGSRS